MSQSKQEDLINITNSDIEYQNLPSEQAQVVKDIALQIINEQSLNITDTEKNNLIDAVSQTIYKTGQQGGDFNLQKAAAVATIAAHLSNSQNKPVVYNQTPIKADISEKELNHEINKIDQSIDKLDYHNKPATLLSLTWPIFIDLSLHFATLIINTVMVGMVSVKAIAELTIGNQVFDLALIIFNFFNVGACVVCAQAIGANNKRLARRVIHIGLGVNLIVGTIVSILIFLSSNLIVDLMKVPAELAESSGNYLRILSLSFLPLAICLFGSAILRAHNCTRDAMFVTLLGNLITVIGNYLFLFGALGVPALGVEGVAISTVIGRLIGSLVYIPLLISRTKTKIIPRFMFVFRKKVIYSILNIGLPGAGENLAWHLQFMFMTGVVATFGAYELATQGIYMQLVQILMLFSISIAMGTEILVARYTGAMKLDLANKQLLRSVKIGEIFTFFLTFSMPLGTGAFIIGMFTESPEVLAIATPLFLLTVFQEPGRILNIIIINSLRATGDSRFPLMMAIISMWGISIPLGCFLGIYMEMGLLGVWIGFATDEWVRGVVMLIRWKSLAWQKHAKKIYESTLKTAASH